MHRFLTFLTVLMLFPVLGMANQEITLAWYQSDGLQDGLADSPHKSGYAYEIYQEISNYTGWQYNYVHGDRESLFQQFNQGKIDVITFLGNNPENYLDGQVLRIGGIARNNLYFCIRKDADSIYNAFEGSFRKLRDAKPYFLRDLYRKYYPTNSFIGLTESDKNWIQEHKQLRIGFSDSYLPFCSIDNKGELSGILSVILREWKASLGIGDELEIVPVPYKHNLYPDMIADLNKGKIDAVFPMLGSYWYSEQNNLMTSTPVVSSSIVAIYKPPFSEEKLKTIATASSAMQYICTNEYFPNSQMVICATRDECLDKILSGQIGSSLYNTQRAQEVLGIDKYSSLAFMPLGIVAEYGFAVRKGNMELLDLMDRGLLMLNKTTLSEKLYDYSTARNKITLKDFIVGNLRWITFTLLILIAVIIGLLMLNLSRSIRNLKENEQLNTELTNNLNIVKSLSHIYNALYYIDLKTGRFRELNHTDINSMAYTFGESGNAREKIAQMCHNLVQQEYKAEAMEFTDLDTMAERLSSVDSISFTFRAVEGRWYRERFVVSTRDSNGVCNSVLWTITDVTKQWEADTQKQRIIDKTIAANEAKTRFLHNMSHEIRTPLNAMFGFAQLLGLPEGTWTAEEREEYNQIIFDSHSMLEMLINDIIDIADSEHGNFRVSISDVNLNNVCRMALKSVEYRVPSGVELRFTSEISNDYIIQSDGQRIQQVIVNYLTNACKHTVNGEIHLHCSVTENPGNMTISVSDTGHGIPLDKADEIFNRFSKLNDFVQGSGLGLSICKMISQKLGGQVFLDNTYTGGARFVFVLPITQAPA